MDDAVSQDVAWQPANPVEAALQDALDDGDHERYLAVLAESTLLVPVVAAADDPVAEPVLATMQLADGAVVVPAYTSPEALARPEAERLTEQQLAIPFGQLAARWPDPRWVLAVNAGLPVATHVFGAELPAVVVSAFAPANDVERELAAAQSPGDVLAALAGAELHLPVTSEIAGDVQLGDPEFPWWRGSSGVDDAPTVVPVFTSVRRLRGQLGMVGLAPESVVVDLFALSESWPGPRWALVVNPGAPFAVTFTGEQVRRLAERLPAALSAGVVLQVAVPDELVPAYLSEGYGKVGGTVHLRPAEPVTPAQLYRAVGLLRPGSPFSAADQSVHVVRWWPEHEDALRWVREARPRTESVQLPAGAQLVELRTGGEERLLATYHPDHHAWIPAD
jgi:hypothetical protein